MKITKAVSLDTLKEYGFVYLTEDTYKEEDYHLEYTDTWGEFLKELDNAWVKEIACGRRNQRYFLIVREDRYIRIFAAEPDGTGSSDILDDTLLDLFEGGLIVK